MSFNASKASLPPDALPTPVLTKVDSGLGKNFRDGRGEGQGPPASTMVPESHRGKVRGGKIAMAGVILPLPFVEPYSTPAQPLQSTVLQESQHKGLSPLNG